MWDREWRDRVWADLDQQWDPIVIGGGITGAGVLCHAMAAGLKTLLVEAGDFSSDTSSRSSKLIHGGLRYILNRQFGVTKESARERERFMQDVPYGLPQHQAFTFVIHSFAVVCSLLLPHRRRLADQQRSRDAYGQ